jgi:hypothetical protein
MDRAKAKVVLEAGLGVARCCGTCVSWCSGQRGAWGTCSSFPYVHEKHRREHQMPVHRFGVCSAWALGDDHAIPQFLALARVVIDSSYETQEAVGREAHSS